MTIGVTEVLLGGLIGLEGLSAFGQSSQAKSQEKLDLATIQLNREEAKLASAEKALMNASSFRKSLASQLAMASFRGGPGSSIASQIGSESMFNFGQDQRAIERGMQGIDTAASLAGAGAKARSSAQRMSAMLNFGTSTLGSINASRAASAPEKGAEGAGESKGAAK